VEIEGILYDSVSAGAGFIEKFYENLEKILEEAKKIVKEMILKIFNVKDICLIKVFQMSEGYI
jgi:hypothetical protein